MPISIVRRLGSDDAEHLELQSQVDGQTNVLFDEIVLSSFCQDCDMW